MSRQSSGLQEARLMLEILKRIPLSHKISTSELFVQLQAAGFSLSRRTLQRYLKALIEADMGVYCDDKSIPFGYRRTINENDLDRVGLGPEGSLLLLMAREHLRFQMPPELTNSLSYLFEAAQRVMQEQHHGTLENQWLDKVCFVSGTLQMQPPLIRPHIFNAVSEGLYKQKKIIFNYTKPNGVQADYRVSPLGLVQQDVRLYLVCCYEDTSQIRHFALHRMNSVEVTDFAADKPAGFNLRRYAKDGFNYGSRGKILLELVFRNPETAKILEETPFNATQKVEKLPDGAFKLTVKIEDSRLLKGWIETWREEAQILSETKTPLS